jgi:hypothetical protein
LVISPTRLSVNRLSINPIAAKIMAYGKIIIKVSKLIGTKGIEKEGRPPATLARSPTLGIGISKPITKPEVKRIATSVAGNIFENYGSSQIIAIVKTIIQ